MAATYDPFVGGPETVRSGVRNRLPDTTPGVALVVGRSGRPPRVLRPPEKLTLGEARWGSIVSIQRIDVSTHRLEFTTSLPSADQVYEFTADVWVTCEVSDPGEVVSRGIHDALEWVRGPVIRVLRAASARFDVHDPMAAEHAIAAAVADDPALKSIPPFVLTGCGAQLKLDSATRDHVRGLREDSRDHERAMQVAELQSELQRKQAELDHLKRLADLDRELAVETKTADLNAERQRLTHEYELRRVNNDGELAAAATRHWGPILGDSAQARLLAVRVGYSREEINSVIESLQRSDDAKLAKAIATVVELVNKDALESAQLDDLINDMLKPYITRHFAAPAIAGEPEPPELDASPSPSTAETDDDEAGPA